jgi:hypothetical protein
MIHDSCEYIVPPWRPSRPPRPVVSNATAGREPLTGEVRAPGTVGRASNAQLPRSAEGNLRPRRG